MLDRMKILVTGGAGFIGSHLCERLLRERHELTVVDDLNDFYPPAAKQANLEAVRRSGSFEFHRADISDEARMVEVFRQSRPEAVVHLAARAGVRPSLEQPILYARVNVLGSTILLEASRRFGVRKFVFASSSSIYGNGNRLPFREDDSLNLPVSPYAATKIAGEKIAYTYSHLYGLQTVCLRFFTVYGPRQRPDLAIRKFATMIDRGQPIPLFGDGSSSRDYTYIDDTIQGVVAALAYDCSYEVFNLGRSEPIRLTDLVRTLEAAMGKKAAIQWMPDQPGDVSTTYADISKARDAFRYQPRIGFRAGIDRFLSWFFSSENTQAAVRAVGAEPAEG
jgi:UDP-glucuronate 4-epimerase